VASRAVAVLLGLSTCLAASTRVPDLKALYEGHRWFALRDALDRTAPVFYRGAVACGFNDVHDCERPCVQSPGPTRDPKKPPRRAGCSSRSTTALDILARRSPRSTRSWRRIQTTKASRARAGSSVPSASTPISPSPGGSGRRSATG
jgi:hypothetical protein